MTCERVEELLSALIDNELDPTTGRNVTEHLNICPACAETRRDLQLLIKASTELEPIAPPDRLFFAIRRETRKVQPRPWFPVRKIGWVLIPAVATVALMLVVFSPHAPSPVPVATQSAPAPIAEETRPVAPAPAEIPVVKPRATARPARRVTPAVPAANAVPEVARRAVPETRAPSPESPMVVATSAAAPYEDARAGLREIQQGLQEIEAAMYRNPGNAQVARAYQLTYRKGVELKDRYLVGTLMSCAVLLPRSLYVLFGFSLTLANSARAVYPSSRPEPKFREHRQVDRTVAVNRDDTIAISNQFGNIQVSTTTAPQIKISAKLIAGADTRACAESCLQHMAVNVEQRGRRVTVSSTVSLTGHSATQFQTDFTVVIPDEAVLTVENSYGDITVTGLQGMAVMTNRFGTTNLHGVRNADVTNAFGDVNLDRMQGLTVRNRVGNVTAHDITGPMQISNETGTIRVMRTCGVMQLDNKLGEIVATDCRGRVRIISRQGTVTFRQTRIGPDTVQISGDRSPIRLKLPVAASACVNARVTRGSIVCGRTLTSEKTGIEGADRAQTFQFGTSAALFDLETADNGITIDLEEGR